MTGIPFPWTDDHLATLKRLWKAGTSATLIARELPGTTRCGVLGKLHRMGFTRESPKPVTRAKASGNKTVHPQKVGKITGKPVVRNAAVRAAVERCEPVAPPLPKPRSQPKAPTPLIVHAAPADAITIHELSDDRCHFPLGDPRSSEFRYCGASVPRAVRDRGRCYCFDHVRLCFQAGTASGPTTARRMWEVVG